jgi:hypothetical protein
LKYLKSSKNLKIGFKIIVVMKATTMYFCLVGGGKMPKGYF